MPLRAESMTSGLFIPKRDYGLHVQNEMEQFFFQAREDLVFLHSHFNESIEIERTLAEA